MANRRVGDIAEDLATTETNSKCSAKIARPLKKSREANTSPAEAAGVLLTVNPVTGVRYELMINAAGGSKLAFGSTLPERSSNTGCRCKHPPSRRIACPQSGSPCSWSRSWSGPPRTFQLPRPSPPLRNLRRWSSISDWSSSRDSDWWAPQSSCPAFGSIRLQRRPNTAAVAGIHVPDSARIQRWLPARFSVGKQGFSVGMDGIFKA